MSLDIFSKKKIDLFKVYVVKNALIALILIMTVPAFGCSGNNQNEMQKYISIANQYKELSDMGKKLQSYRTQIDQAGQYYFKDYPNKVEALYDAKESLRALEEEVNKTIESIPQLIDASKDDGIDIGDMKQIIDKYSDSINYYSDAYGYLEDYDSIGKSERAFNDFLSNCSGGTFASMAGIMQADKGYELYYAKTQNNIN